MRDFKKLQIWEKGMDIVVDLYRLTDTFPETERYGLVSQMRRAAISIPSNIAEGSSRYSEKEQFRFSELSLGSSFELETQLRASDRLGFVKTEMSQELLHSIVEEQRMISGFMRQLNFKR